MIGALLVSILLRAFVGQMFIIPSQSMENTLQIGDRVVVEKLSSVKRGQVVVFTDAHAKVANLSIPESLLDSVLDSMTQSAPLPELNGVDYTDLHADEDGLTIEMSGDNVRLADLRIR